MSTLRPVAVLRPEPGNAATAARAEALGMAAIRLPLFRVVPRAWAVPDAAGFDALLLTSASAARRAGPGLAALAGLPALAVGAATAAAARAAGLDVRLTGTAGVDALLGLAAEAGIGRVLHLAGAHRTPLAPAVAGLVAARATVYASEAVPVGEEAVRALAGSVALLHSARAAVRLAALVDARGAARGAIAALSETVAAAAGTGWAAVAVARAPADDALLAAARELAAPSLGG